MRSAAVDEVDFFHAAFNRVEGGGDFWDHATGDGTVGEEFAGLFFGHRFDEGRFVRRVAEESGNIGKVDQLGWFESASEGGGCEVGIDIVSFAGVEVTAERGDDRQEACR